MYGNRGSGCSAGLAALVAVVPAWTRRSSTGDEVRRRRLRRRSEPTVRPPTDHDHRVPSTTTTTGRRPPRRARRRRPRRATTASATTARPSPPAAPADPLRSATIRLTRGDRSTTRSRWPCAPPTALWIARKGGAVCRLERRIVHRHPDRGDGEHRRASRVSSASRSTPPATASTPATRPAGRHPARRVPVRAQRHARTCPPRRNIFAEDHPEANHNGGNVLFGPDGLPLPGPRGRRRRRRSARRRRERPGPRTPTSARSCASTRRDRSRAALDQRGPQPVAVQLRPGHRRPVDRPTSGRTRGRRSTSSRPAPSRAATSAGAASRAPTASAPARPPAGTPVRSTSTPTTRAAPITGGYVYRGAKIPALVGAYLFSDYCDGEIRGLSTRDGGLRNIWRPLGVDPATSSRSARPATATSTCSPRPRCFASTRPDVDDAALLQVLHDAASAVRTALDGLADWGLAGTRPGQYRSDLAADEAALAVLDAAGLGRDERGVGAPRRRPGGRGRARPGRRQHQRQPRAALVRHQPVRARRRRRPRRAGGRPGERPALRGDARRRRPVDGRPLVPSACDGDGARPSSGCPATRLARSGGSSSGRWARWPSTCAPSPVVASTPTSTAAPAPTGPGTTSVGCSSAGRRARRGGRRVGSRAGHRRPCRSPHPGGGGHPGAARAGGGVSPNVHR